MGSLAYWHGPLRPMLKPSTINSACTTHPFITLSLVLSQANIYCLYLNLPQSRYQADPDKYHHCHEVRPPGTCCRRRARSSGGCLPHRRVHGWRQLPVSSGEADNMSTATDGRWVERSEGHRVQAGSGRREVMASNIPSASSPLRIIRVEHC